MLQTLKELETQFSNATADTRPKTIAYQHLLLLVGIHLFKVWPLEGWGMEPQGKPCNASLWVPWHLAAGEEKQDLAFPEVQGASFNRG